MNAKNVSGYTFYDSYFSKSDDDSSNQNLEEIIEKNKKPITFGKCSRFYLYILASGSCKMLSTLILGANNVKENGIGLFGFCPVLIKFNFVQSIFTYIGFIIFGLIFYYCKDPEKSKSKEKKENDESFNRMRTFLKNIAQNKTINNVKKNINLKIVFLCIAFAVHIETKKLLYNEGFQFFNLWTAEIIFMQLLMRKYFTIDYYKHHKVSILFNAIFCSSILIFTSFLPSSLYYEDQENYVPESSLQNLKDKLGSYFYSILLIAVYMLLSFVFCFTRIYSKVLMEIKFISPYKLVFLFGIAGLVISLLASVVGYYINYPDNLFNYFSSLKSVLNEGKYYYFYGEIFLVSPINAFANSMEFIFEILTIYYLNPFYILLSNTLYYAISQFIFFMLNLSSDDLVITHFVITELTEFLTCFGLMVYLEIIELNFCGLDNNLKKTIMKKGEKEFKLLSFSTIDDDIEENNNDIDDENIVKE